MEKKEKGEQMLQWHPAFFADIQIEFREEEQRLIFENEHHLGTKPKQIDVLIIKKDSEEPIQKNIGRIFRKYNIVEYKSPDDSLSIDDFYKGIGYACLYKADSGSADCIKAEEITVSFVCTRYPLKLMKHLKSRKDFRINQEEDGIYYIYGAIFPVQIIITSRLHTESNFWLKNLTNKLGSREVAGEILKKYQNHKNENLYSSVMDIIIRANKEQFQRGDSNMCDALLELVKDDIEQGREQGREQGIQQGIFSTLVSLVNQGLLQVSDAARQVNLSVEEFEERIQEFG